jgi:hypothetical protein
MTAATPKTTTEAQKYAGVIERIENVVGYLNEALGLSTEFDKDHGRNCVTFGYIGNLERWGDDREWMVFLPRTPGTLGAMDRIGGFRTNDLEGARYTLILLSGALAMAAWQKQNKA